MSDDTLATTVRNLRLARAWPQEHLAAAAGTSARTIQRIEQGHRPSLETLSALAAALDVPLSRLNGASPAPQTDGDAEMCPDPSPRHDRDRSVRRYYRHLATYAVVMAILAGLNLTFSPGHTWFVYPLVGWGVPLALKGAALLRRTDSPA